MAAGRNVDWTIKQNSDGTFPTEQATIAILLDIRQELKKLNGVFECGNFLRIPRILDAIRLNTRKVKKRKSPKVTQI